MRSYLRAVKRKLNLPPEVKSRVMADFTSSIESRREAGKSTEAILAELGSPAQAAAELNGQMQEFAYEKSPWRWVCLGVAIVCAGILLCNGGAQLMLAIWGAASSQSVGIIGGADGPTTVFITRSDDFVFYEMAMAILVLIMSLMGFWFLGHLRKKD